MFNVTLAKEYTPKKLPWPCVVMPKLDGVRAVFRRVLPDDEISDDGQYHFFSRGGQEKQPKAWNDNVVAHILEPLRTAVGSSNTILDGEFYRHGWKCQRINGAIAVKRKEPSAETSEIRYTIFDAAGPVADLGFLSRLQHAKTVTGGRVSNVDFIEYSMAKNEVEVAQFQADIVNLGYEGTMVRNHAAPYENKRTYNLQKFKDFQDAEFKCVGVYEGKETDKGSRLVGTLGGLNLIAANGEPFECGSGFDDETRYAIWTNPKLVIGKQITVKYFELTAPPKEVPRFPIFVSVRDYE